MDKELQKALIATLNEYTKALKYTNELLEEFAPLTGKYARLLKKAFPILEKQFLDNLD